jgi:hypothetical protein
VREWRLLSGTVTHLSEWTVDYGDGQERHVQVPHAWRQDVPVTWEGPAIYRTHIDVPLAPSWLLFHGVSYACVVRANGTEIGRHAGIWDAFTVSLKEFIGQEVNLEVEVVKNGGASYPVREVASGFLPFVYHTFGGIYGRVDLVQQDRDPLELTKAAPPTRVKVDGTKISLDGKPFYARGVLTWGWYPEVGHTNPPEEAIRAEVAAVKAQGFNLIKFCLWVPPHRYLEIMREEGLEAWLELPLWDPTPDTDRQEEIAVELERIVSQYRRHGNIVIWTVGCELSTTTSAAYRQRLTKMVKDLTGSPLVKDNSGGSEMYGGDLREYGDFYDFHPYCDTPFYPPVLDSLLPGPRRLMPILLGEFNDIDVHRDLPRTLKESPYWASPESDLNDIGVRWQMDLPRVLVDNRFAHHPEENRHEWLMKSSVRKAVFIRKFVQEAVRAREEIGGYVITGWSDTPISTAGFIDDWGDRRFADADLQPWNGPNCLFLIPSRRPPWVHGGNRPGWIDPHNHFAGRVFWKVGLHSENSLRGRLEWDIVHFNWEGGARPKGRVASGQSDFAAVGALESAEVGQITWEDAEPGGYLLRVKFGTASNSWPIWIVPKPSFEELTDWSLHDPADLFAGSLPRSASRSAGVSPVTKQVLPTPNGGASLYHTNGNGILFLTGEGATPAPFWRESAYEFGYERFWQELGLAHQWERLLPISGDRVIDMEWLRSQLPKNAEIEVLLNRIDVRTYAEAPVAIRATTGEKQLIVTTLRPFGGLGIQPLGLNRNPAGAALLLGLMKSIS